MCPTVDEVVGPDVVGMLGLQAYNEPSLNHSLARSGCLAGTSQPFPPPQSLDPFVIDGPT